MARRTAARMVLVGELRWRRVVTQVRGVASWELIMGLGDALPWVALVCSSGTGRVGERGVRVSRVCGSRSLAVRRHARACALRGVRAGHAARARAARRACACGRLGRAEHGADAVLRRAHGARCAASRGAGSGACAAMHVARGRRLGVHAWRSARDRGQGRAALRPIRSKQRRWRRGIELTAGAHVQ